MKDAGAFGVSYAPASFILNGTDEILSRTNATSSPTPNAIALTASIWLRGQLTGTNVFHPLVSRADASNFCRWIFGGPSASPANPQQYGNLVTSTLASVSAGGAYNNEDAWHHYTFVYDSANGTEEDRCEFYQDGSLQTDTEITTISASEAHNFWTNARTLAVASHPTVFAAASFKAAFIEVLEGVIAAPTDFAFNNGGTWTRKRYTGSYGTYGFNLDGTDGFNDVSGNGQHFTGTNMTTADNLDFLDLPPYVNL